MLSFNYLAVVTSVTLVTQDVSKIRHSYGGFFYKSNDAWSIIRTDCSKYADWSKYLYRLVQVYVHFGASIHIDILGKCSKRRLYVKG